MYVDSSRVTARRSCSKATRHTATAGSSATAARRRPVTAATRRTRLADAIVSQWLLEQVPPDHRHALRGASDLRRELAV
jgi:hypothetical protein